MRSFIIFLSLLSTIVKSQNLPANIHYLALGDSYTIGESVNEQGRWPNQFVDSLSKLGYVINQNDIVATTGWTTGNLLNGMENADLKPEYNLISILIGVNNFYQYRPVDEYRMELSEIIDSALVLSNQDTNAIFLVTIPDYGYTPFGQSQISTISANTNLYNAIKDSTAKEYGIPVYDITEISRDGLNDQELVATDGLHPSVKQYGLWVDKIIEEMIGLPSSVEEVHYLLDGDGLVIKSEDAAVLKVLDTNGRIVFESEIPMGSSLKFTLPTGFYLMNLTSEKVTQVSKFYIK